MIRIFDGVTSFTLIYNYLTRVFPNINLTWSNHLPDKKHGIDIKLIPDGVDLLLITDAGSNEYEIHKELYEKGIEILILDHHEAPNYSEHALIINPQLDDYPNKWLSGAGVVYKFIQHFDKHFGLNGSPEDFADICAWGLIGDAMQVSSKETKWLIANGLNNIKNEFLIELIKENVDKSVELTPTIFSFKINPKVNGYLRMASTEDLDDLIKAFIGHQEVTYNSRLKKADKSETWARRITRTANNMYSKQRKIKGKLLEELSLKIEREKLHENSFIIIELEGEFNMNMSGYISSFLVSKYRKPTLVLRRDEKDEKFLVGSMRGYDSFMVQTKDFLQGLNLFDFVEGHQGAAGLRIGYDNFKILDVEINKALSELVFDESHIVDLILPAFQISKSFVKEVESFSRIWGKGLEQPLYAVENLEVNLSDAEAMGKTEDMIKIMYNGVELVKFSGASELIELKKGRKTVVMNVVGKTGMNSYKGNVTPQFVIEDMEIIEVKDSARFVF